MVVDVGIESTPTVARAVDWYDADVGVVVTASHNPPNHNGFKLWTAEGRAFDRDGYVDVVRRINRDAPTTASPSGMGSVRTEETASQRHLDRLCEAAGDLDGLSVVVDVGNGTGGLTADTLAALGCDLTTLDAQCDGSFPSRPSEPTDANCETLRKTVEATGADLGIAHDADADRMLAVDDRGRFVSGDQLLGLFTRETVEPGDRIAAPINASALVDDVACDVGGVVVRTEVGDTHIAKACSEPDVVFGGEPSGAWIWPDETPCPDGHYAACRLAELVAENGPLSRQVDALPEYWTRRESLSYDSNAEVVADVAPLVRARYDEVTDTDGVRVDFDDGWFLIRASGTEPLVRVTAEATERERANELLDEATALVDERPNVRAKPRAQPVGNDSVGDD